MYIQQFWRKEVRVKNITLFVFTAIVGALALPSIATAGFVDGLGQPVIGNPPSVEDDPPGATNTNQEGFVEAENIELIDPLLVDGGSIPAGTIVTSHMIFLNTLGAGITSDPDRYWVFTGPILGVMSDSGGVLEAASNAILGASGTFYPGAFAARGMESADSYTVVSPHELRVSMRVSEPGDWIRVVTEPDAKKVTLCHIPPGNPSKAKTKSVGLSAVAAHLQNHGDFLGECPGDTDPGPDPGPSSS